MMEGMVERVKAFVEGPDHVALVVGSPASDALPLLKIFEEVETSSASDLFWTFTDTFVDPWSYASAIVSEFRTRHEAMCEAMEAEGMTPWPADPARGHGRSDATRAASARAVRLLARPAPVPFGGNNVWVFFPLEVQDPGSFAELVAEVLVHDFPFPWCHHLRFIVRDDIAFGSPGAATHRLAARRLVAARPEPGGGGPGGGGADRRRIRSAG